MSAKPYCQVILEDSPKYYELWKETPSRSLDYTLANVWGWQDYFSLEWRFDDEICWLRQTQPEMLYWAPIGNWEQVDWHNAFANCDVNIHNFIRVPETLLGIWENTIPDLITYKEEDRGQFEYLYNQTDLANLSGNRYHKKKNLCKQYVKAYGEPDFRPVNEMVVEDILGLQDNWCQWHECEASPSLTAENMAINRVLSHWDHFPGMYGGALYIEDKIVAFSVGEQLDSDSLGVHYEKGINGIKGVYQMVNQTFAAKIGSGFNYINRAQDMNEIGLRQAKESYQPCGFLKKYKVRIEMH